MLFCSVNAAKFGLQVAFVFKVQLMLHSLLSVQNFLENCLVAPYLAFYFENAFDVVWASTFKFWKQRPLLFSDLAAFSVAT